MIQEEVNVNTGPNIEYSFYAQYVKNYDGDTIDFIVDLGFSVFVNARVRLARIDTPEMRGGTIESKEWATVVRDYVQQFLIRRAKGDIKITTEKKGKYGRYIAEVWVYTVDGWVNLTDTLLNLRMGELYE